RGNSAIPYRTVIYCTISLGMLARALSPLVFTVLLRAAGPEFEANSGQAESQHLFLARVRNTRVYIQDRGIEFSSAGKSRVRLLWAAGPSWTGEPWTALDPTGNVSYYCNQPDPIPCRQGVPSYRRLVRRDLY